MDWYQEAICAFRNHHLLARVGQLRSLRWPVRGRHVWFWWAFDDSRLPLSMRAIIAEATNQIVISAASAWEIATKVRSEHCHRRRCLHKTSILGESAVGLVRCYHRKARAKSRKLV